MAAPSVSLCLPTVHTKPQLTADTEGYLLTLRTGFGSEVAAVADALVPMTLGLRNKVQAKLLPTPAKFHYLFNMLELSKVRWLAINANLYFPSCWACCLARVLRATLPVALGEVPRPISPSPQVRCPCLEG